MKARARAPRVLVAGALLGQAMGGVRRHNAELLSRARERLAADGGRLVILEGRQRIQLPHPEQYERLQSDVPSGPPWARARAESAALEEALSKALTQREPFDLVHTAHLPAPHGLPVPFTLTLHDLRRLARFPQRLVAGPILAASIRRAAGVVTVSETVREQVRQRFQPRRTWVVPNAGDHLQAAPRAAPPEAFLLHVGHLEPRKNIALLLHALARDTTLPGLTLAGAAKDKEQERLAAMSRRLGIHERVRFLGPFADADLPELYARCAAAVFPSRIEGFGIGVIEALRAKAPVAIAAAGALPEIAGPGVPQFAPDDPLDCARAIHEALELNAGQRDELARNAARFAWQKSAERLVEVWREVAAPL